MMGGLRRELLGRRSYLFRGHSHFYFLLTIKCLISLS